MGTDGDDISTSQADSTVDAADTSDEAGAEAFARNFESWKESVETRFGQVGDAFAALGGSGERGTGTTQSGTTPTPKTRRAAAAPPAAAAGTAPSGAAAATGSDGDVAGDIKQPQSTHWWYRDAPWKRGK